MPCIVCERGEGGVTGGERERRWGGEEVGWERRIGQGNPHPRDEAVLGAGAGDERMGAHEWGNESKKGGWGRVGAAATCFDDTRSE